MPSAGGVRFVVDGSEEVAEVRESVRVVRRAGRVGGAAMLEGSEPFDVWRDSKSKVGFLEWQFFPAWRQDFEEGWKANSNSDHKCQSQQNEHCI